LVEQAFRAIPEHLKGPSPVTFGQSVPLSEAPQPEGRRLDAAGVLELTPEGVQEFNRSLNLHGQAVKVADPYDFTDKPDYRNEILLRAFGTIENAMAFYFTSPLQISDAEAQADLARTNLEIMKMEDTNAKWWARYELDQKAQGIDYDFRKWSLELDTFKTNLSAQAQAGDLLAREYQEAEQVVLRFLEKTPDLLTNERKLSNVLLEDNLFKSAFYRYTEYFAKMNGGRVVMETIPLRRKLGLLQAIFPRKGTVEIPRIAPGEASIPTENEEGEIERRARQFAGTQ
jgi:hypothetical protein